jgi:hypothetical protein
MKKWADVMDSFTEALPCEACGGPTRPLADRHPQAEAYAFDVCDKCQEDIANEEAYCVSCSGGHWGGEFGEYCPANGAHWFAPSDPRDIDDRW